MSNNAPDYENDLVFPPKEEVISMPRCDIEELQAKLDIARKALVSVLVDAPACFDECVCDECEEWSCCQSITAKLALAKIKGGR